MADETSFCMETSVLEEGFAVSIARTPPAPSLLLVAGGPPLLSIRSGVTGLDWERSGSDRVRAVDEEAGAWVRVGRLL